ncbi:ankyrin repeat-containing domain protein [Aspergillus terricola var. indicus]
MNFGIADVDYIIRSLKDLISANSNATINFTELNSECELLKANLEAAKEHCASQHLSKAEREHTEINLDRCNETLARLKTYLTQGRSLKSGLPSVHAIRRFSNKELAQWKDTLQAQNIKLLMVFSRNASASSWRVEDRVALLTGIIVDMWLQMQAAFPSSLKTTNSLPVNGRRLISEIRLALTKRGIDPDMLSQYEAQILQRAETIISSNSEPEIKAHAFRNQSAIRNALLEAIAQSNWDRVKMLLDNNPRLDIKTPEARLTFAMAVTQQMWEIVQSLLAMGMDPDGTSASRGPAICVAASYQAWDTVRLLVQHGANVQAKESTGHTAVIRAASHREWEMVLFLTDAGADIRKQVLVPAPDTWPEKIVTRISVLSYLATYGDWNRLEDLLRENAHPESEALSGNPIITVAAKSKCWYAVQLLVKYNANLNVVDRVGRSALAYTLSALLARWPPTPTDEERLEIARVAASLLKEGARVGKEELSAFSLSPWSLEVWKRTLTPQATADDLMALLKPPSTSELGDSFVF